MNRALIVSFVLTVILSFSVQSKAQPMNFSGDWIRNTEKCDAGDLSINSIPTEISIIQEGSTLQITRTAKNAAGEVTTYVEKLTANGEKAESKVKSNVNKVSTIESTAGNKGITEKADYTDDMGNPIQKVKESWSLSDDGKTLTIQKNLTFKGQEHILMEIYNKK